MNKPAMTIPELLPCPFCGGEPSIEMTRGNGRVVYCASCMIPHKKAANLEDAAAQWNTRASQPLLGVQRPEDVARADLAKRLRHYLNYNEHDVGPVARDLLRESLAVLALPHTGQPQEGAIVRQTELLSRLRGSGPLQELRVQAADELDALYGMLRRRISAAPASPRAEGE